MSPKSPKESSSSDLSPYPLVRVERGDDIIYSFITQDDVTYEIVFKSDANYLSQNDRIAHLFYSFILTRVSLKVGVADERIKATIVYALIAVFSNNPELVISYQCSTANSQQRARARLFRQWFTEFGQEYIALNYTNLFDAYVTTIYKRGNPYGVLIQEVFTEIFYNK